MKTYAQNTVLLTAIAGIILLIASAMAPPSDAAVFQSAKSLYASKCAVCHGNDGNANTAKGKELKTRAFTAPEFKKMPDAKAMEVIMKGKGKMEGYEKTLGKEKIEQLLQYCRELSNK